MEICPLHRGKNVHGIKSSLGGGVGRDGWRQFQDTHTGSEHEETRFNVEPFVPEQDASISENTDFNTEDEMMSSEDKDMEGFLHCTTPKAPKRLSRPVQGVRSKPHAGC